MIKFVRNNWKMLLVSALATTAAAVCIFNPPGFIASAIIGLSSSPVFSIFGAYAAQAATATIALAAAASTFLGATVVNAGYNLASRLLSACWARIRPNTSAKKGAPTNEDDFWARIRPNTSAKKGAPTNEDDFEEEDDLEEDHTQDHTQKKGSVSTLGRGLGQPKVRKTEVEVDQHSGETLNLTGRGKKPVGTDEQVLDHTSTTRLGMGGTGTGE